MSLEPLARPGCRLAGPKVAPVPLDQQTAEAANDVVVDLDELLGGVAGPKVVAPAAQDRVQVRDDLADVLARSPAAGLGFDRASDARHRSLRGPALEVVAANAALQHPTRHAGSEVAAEEVKALPALSEVNHLRLLRMQPK